MYTRTHLRARTTLRRCAILQLYVKLFNRNTLLRVALIKLSLRNDGASSFFKQSDIMQKLCSAIGIIHSDTRTCFTRESKFKR